MNIVDTVVEEVRNKWARWVHSVSSEDCTCFGECIAARPGSDDLWWVMFDDIETAVRRELGRELQENELEMIGVIANIIGETPLYQ